MTDAEETALAILRHHGGSMLLSQIPERQERDALGVVPGISTYRKLERLGLVMITEEDVDELGFAFTSMVELVKEEK